MPITPFYLWTLYDHPLDFPDCFVARKYSGLTGKATDEYVTGATPGEVLVKIQAIDPNPNMFLPRDPGDDPKIMGTWI